MNEEEMLRRQYKMKTGVGKVKKTLVLEEVPAIQNPMNEDVRSCVGCFLFMSRPLALWASLLRAVCACHQEEGNDLCAEDEVNEK